MRRFEAILGPCYAFIAGEVEAMVNNGKAARQIRPELPIRIQLASASTDM